MYPSTSAPKADPFRNLKAFVHSDQLLGLPAKVFMGGLTFSAALSIALHWWVGLIAAALYFPTMARIHREDPYALVLWARSTRRSEHLYICGLYKNRAITWL